MWAKSLFLVSLLFALCANATVLNVSPEVAQGSPCNSTVNCNVQDAFLAAVSGDTISLTTGTYKINSTLVPPSNVSIQGVANTVIFCNVSSLTGFHLDSKTNVSLNGITVTNCSLAFNIQSSTVNFKNCDISQNARTTTGAGIYSATSTLTLISTNFVSNAAANGGALYLAASTITLSGCNFTTNQATENGGAIMLDTGASNVNITNCNFNNNTANSGGGIFAGGGSVGIFSGSFSGNKATENGGAGLVGACLSFSATSVTVSGGGASSGAGFYVQAVAASTFSNVNIDASNIAETGNAYFLEPAANVSISNGVAAGIAMASTAPGPQIHSVTLTASNISFCCAGSSVKNPSSQVCDYPSCEAGKCANTTTGCQCPTAQPTKCPTCVSGWHGDFCEISNPQAFDVTISGNEDSYILVSLNVTDPTGQFTLCNGLNPSIQTFPSAGSLATSSLSPISSSSPDITSCNATFYYRAPAHGAYTGPLNFTYGVEAGGFSSLPAFVLISLTSCTTGLCGCGDSVCDSEGSSENCNTCPQDCPSPCSTAPVLHNATVHLNESSYTKINLNITDTQGSTPCNGLNITVTQFPAYGKLFTSNLSSINSSFPDVCDTVVYYEAPAHDSYPFGTALQFSYRVSKDSYSSLATVMFQLAACLFPSQCGCGDGVCNVAAGENCLICATDCPRPCGLCGDGECSASENCTSCASDCCGPPTPAPTPLSNVTIAPTPLSNVTSAPTNPPTANLTCGDGMCDNSTENCTTCFEDCYVELNCTSVCGDGICDIFENCTTCLEDCNSTCVIPTPPPSDTHKVDPHKAKIAVIVIGAVFGGFVVAILIVALLRRRKPRQLTRARRQNTGTELRRMTSDNVLINNSQNSLLRTESTV